MRIPEYWITKDYSFYDTDVNQVLELPQHSFIKPFWNKQFVPEAIKKTCRNDEGHVWCYTNLGIILIPRDYIEEAYD